MIRQEAPPRRRSRHGGLPDAPRHGGGALRHGSSKRRQSQPRKTLAALVAAALLLGVLFTWNAFAKDDPESGQPAATADPASVTTVNNLAKLPAADILKRARAAALGAGSAHIVARFERQDGLLEIDTKVRGTTGAGVITVDGLGAEVRRLDDIVYLKGNDAFNQESAGRIGARLLEGKWLYGPANNTALADAAASLNYETVVKDALKIDGKLVKQGVTKLEGIRVVALRDADSYIYVAIDGTPYPVAIRGRNGGKDRVRMTEWGGDVVVERPAEEDLIDISAAAQG